MPFTYFSTHEFPHTRNYDSDLREVLYYMREFEEALNHFEEVIVGFEDAIKDIDSMKAAIKALQDATADLNIIRNDIDRLFKDTSTMADSIQSIKGTLVVLDGRIGALKTYVDSENYRLSVEMQFHVIMLQNQIDELREAIMRIDTSFVNPWHQEMGRVNLQDNVNFFYSDLADAIPTAEEYCRLGLTADEYAAYELPAKEYCLRGKKHLHFYWVYAPVYGWRQEISNVLTSIVNAIKGTMSASEYSALDLDADAYAALDLTSEEYFSYGSQHGNVTVSPSNIGLTKLQYERLGVQ